MLIRQVKNAQRVGHLIIREDHDKKLALITDKKITKEQLRNNTGRVYFLTVDGVIEKIGGSQSKGGIQATIAAYLAGFSKGMSPRSYCGWNFCRKNILAGKKVEFYFILAPMTTARIPSMSTWKEVEIATDFHQIETACVEEYKSKEGKFPYLNMQESGKRWIDTGLLEGYPGIIDTKK